MAYAREFAGVEFFSFLPGYLFGMRVTKGCISITTLFSRVSPNQGIFHPNFINTMKRISKVSLLIALFAALMLAAGCEREAVQPATPTLEGFKTDLSDTSMTEAEFMALYKRVGEIAQNPPAGQPQLATINRRYNVTYGTNATVSIGGAAYNRSISEWQGGATAGNVTVSGSIFSGIVAGLPRRVRLVEEVNWFPIHQLIIYLEDQGNYPIYGLIDANTGNYLFLGAGLAGNAQCGAVALGQVSGQVTPNQLNIINGSHGYFATLACVPAVVAGSVAFYYTGVAIP